MVPGVLQPLVDRNHSRVRLEPAKQEITGRNRRHSARDRRFQRRLAVLGDVAGTQSGESSLRKSLLDTREAPGCLIAVGAK
jgi:hypothetical protein